MNKIQNIKELLIQNNGVIKTSEITKHGIDNKYIQRAVESNVMEKYCSGTYIDPELYFDSLYVVNRIINQSVYNLETALIIHNYNNQILNFKTIAAPKKNNKIGNVEVFVEKNLHLGKMKVKTNEGNYIYVFDMERTICDLISHKDKVDIDVYSQAIQKYFTSKHRDMEKLTEYAKELKIYNEVKPIMEVFYATKY